MDAMMESENRGGLRAVGDEPWVACTEVARACGVSTKTIYRLADAGVGFPFIPVGSRNKRFVVSEVKAWIRAHPDLVAKAAAERGLKEARSSKPRKGDA